MNTFFHTPLYSYFIVIYIHKQYIQHLILKLAEPNPPICDIYMVNSIQYDMKV